MPPHWGFYFFKKGSLDDPPFHFLAAIFALSDYTLWKKSVSFQRENQIRLRGKFLQQQNGHFVFMVRPIISSDYSYNKVSNTKEVVLCHSVSDVAAAAAVSVAAAAASDHLTSG
jgi:hypothetical protein